MRIEPCPRCGRTPVITEMWGKKNGTRQRMCRCPQYCSVIPRVPLHCYQFALVYEGDGDDNAILRNWNSAVRFYKKHGWMSYGQWEKVPAWTDDPHVREFTFG